MNEIWGEDVGKAFKLWITGEPAKTFVMRRLTERLGVSSDDGALERLFGECVKEAFEKIRGGDFAQPRDWLLSITSFLGACRILGAQGVLRDQARLHVFRSMMQAVVDTLVTGAPPGAAAQTFKSATEVQADVLLLGDVTNLQSLADGLNDRGKVALVIDTHNVASSAEGRAIVLAAIRNVRRAIVIFEATSMPQDKQILEAITQAKQGGKAVAFVPMPTTSVQSILEICK